jgi:hypothetical protein
LGQRFQRKVAPCKNFPANKSCKLTKTTLVTMNRMVKNLLAAFPISNTGLTPSSSWIAKGADYPSVLLRPELVSPLRHHPHFFNVKVTLQLMKHFIFNQARPVQADQLFAA